VKIVREFPFKRYSNNPDMIFSKDVKETNIRDYPIPCKGKKDFDGILMVTKLKETKLKKHNLSQRQQQKCIKVSFSKD
jgi:hypothetical protein